MGRVKTTSEAELRELVAQGKNFRQIAEEVGIPHMRILATACTLGIKSAYRGRPKKGLSASEYLEKLGEGKTLSQIASEVGVSRQAVFQTLKQAGHPTTCREYLRQQTFKRLTQFGAKEGT